MTISTNTFTKKEIRKFLVSYFGLNELDSYGQGKDGIINYLEQVGCIQSDPLNIVGTNMTIVLNTRFKNLESRVINELLYEDRHLMDGFDKEAAVYLSKHWQKFSSLRKVLSQEVSAWITYRGHGDVLKQLDYVKKELKEKGPLSSRDIDLGRADKEGWGGNTYSNMILRYLWHKGDIGISYKKHNIPYYDVIEKLIPEMLNKEEKMNDNQIMEWMVLRRLDSLGLYWTKGGSGWLGSQFKDKKLMRDTIKELVAKRELMEITIEGIDNKFYLTNGNYQKLLDSKNVKLKNKLSFIAPLDNFIWDRQLIKELFNFEYTWEVYVPEKKRKYGYYVLPILYKDEFIGRVEPSRDKKRTSKFVIESIWFEDEKYNNDKINSLISKEIARFNKYFE